METSHKRWLQYWNERSTPEHREDTEEFYRFHARELRMLFGVERVSRGLEIGCGTGSLYPHFGLEHATYVGVDFSEAMLAEFKRYHPGVTLHLAEGSNYRDASRYDVIFSNGTVQYFDRRMLEMHLANARSMMHSQSSLILGSVPWRRHRFAFYAGALARPYRARPVRGLRAASISWVIGMSWTSSNSSGALTASTCNFSRALPTSTDFTLDIG